jgi:Flp pilus assembly protein TadD
MKSFVKFNLVLVAASLTLSSCNCFKKMSKHQDEVSYTCTPKVLTLNNGVVGVNITVNFPASYFNKKATLRLTPIIVFEGGEVIGTPKYVQGEKVNDNYTVISSTNGGSYSQYVEFPYDERMAQCELRVLVESKCKNASEFVLYNASTGKAVTTDEAAVLANPKSAAAIALHAKCAVFVADGVNTLQKDFNFGDATATADNNYKRTTNQVDKADILYQINSSVVNQKALKNNEQIAEFEKTVAANKENDRVAQNLYVNGYASPDGPEKFNDKLASARSNTGRQAVEKILSQYGFNIDAAGYGEDWEGFKEMVEQSNIQDKDLILQVLSMYDSSAERESQIKNMSSVYGELKDDVLPKLRRAQLVNNMEITGKSDAEMLALVNNNKLDELTNEELLYIAEQLSDNSLKAKVLEYAAQKYNDSRAYTNLGATYLKEGATEKALAALKQAVKLGGNTQALNSNLALANLAAGNVDEAKKYATAADSKTKSLVSAAQGQYSAATSQLSGYNAAVAAVLNNDLSAAKKSLASETTADADYLRAVVATKEGDLKTAAAQLKAAIAKDASLAKKAVKDINLKDLFKSGFTL